MNVADYLCKLISFPSLTQEKKECQRVLNWFYGQIKHLPLYFHFFENEGHHSLVITTQETRKPIVLLHSHVDVVDKDIKRQFEAHIKDGKMFGRGAYDMKFATACYLNLLLELGNKVSEYDFGVMLTSDEERGGFHGTNELVKQGWLPEFCISPDAGTNWNYEAICKGVYQFRVVVGGKPAHSSRPWEGESAISKLLLFIQELQKEFPVEPCGTDDHAYSTINIGRISGGRVLNKLAGQASAAFDIRYMPDTSVEKLNEMVNKIALLFTGIKVFELANSKCSINDYSNEPHFCEFYSIAKDMFGIEASPELSHGSSDARFFTERSIPVLSTRPAGGGLHSKCEWIDIKDLNRFHEVIKTFIIKTTML